MALWEEWQDYNAFGWNETQAELFRSALSDSNSDVGWGDYELQQYFDLAFLSNESMDLRSFARDQLIEILSDRYGLDFDNEFDWENFRAYYDTAE